MTDSHEHVGLRFMSRFRCLGSTCEDPCCLRWQITVDDRAFRAIARALGDTPEGEHDLARAIRKLPIIEQTPERVGDMALRADGGCVMLEPDNLCSLHRRFGEDVLSDTCSTYPRAVGRLDAREEMSGVTSCPEIVRLLLADDAVDEVPLDSERFARRHYSFEHDGAAAARFHTIRAFMLELLRLPYPIAACHMMLATFAERASFVDDRDVDEAMASFRDPATIAGLARSFAAAKIDGAFAAMVVLGLLDAEAWPSDTRFGALVPRITARYATARKKGALDPRQVATIHRKRADALPANLAARLEHHLRNYSINNLYQEWFTACPSLLDFATLHLTQVATVRFLVINHPDTSKAGCDLDAVFVECTSAFSRAANHSGGLGARIMSKLSEGGMQTAENLFSLARV